jgi:hypothetical protein
MGPREVRAAMGIQIEGHVGRPIPGAHVAARMGRALSRLPVQPATAPVRFADVTGPKGGNDIRCGKASAMSRRARPLESR